MSADLSNVKNKM